MAHKGETLVSTLDKGRRTHPDREALISYNEDMERKAITYQELWTLSKRFAHIMKEEGLKRNDIVVVSCAISIEYYVVCYGIFLAGGVVCNMEELYEEGTTISGTVIRCEAKFIVINGGEDDIVRKYLAPNAKIHLDEDHKASFSRADLPTLSSIILCHHTSNNGKTRLMDLLRASKDEFVDEGLSASDGASIAASMSPTNKIEIKMCESSHGSLVVQARMWEDLISFSKMLVPLPWLMMAGSPFLTAIGRTRIIPDMSVPLKNTHPLDLHQKILQVEPGNPVLLNTPSFAAHVLEKNQGRAGGKCLKTMVSGGMSLTRKVFQSLQQVAEKTYYFYGFSETGGMVSAFSFGQTDEFPGAGYAGKAVKNTEVRILNDKLEEVPPGETGVVAVKSPSVFNRYAGNPEKTKKCFIKDGWFLTEDSGSMRSNGDLFVYGRAGDVINRGIIITTPAWLEIPISKHPDIMDVTVVPVPDSFNVQATCACVVKRTGSHITAEDIKQQVVKECTADGGIYIILDHVVFFDKVLPRLSRAKLGELAAERLGLVENTT